MKKTSILFIIILNILIFVTVSCNSTDKDFKNSRNIINSVNLKKDIDASFISRMNIEKKKYLDINYEGCNLVDRYTTPEDYNRIAADNGSFAEYLRMKKLKAYGTKALYYNGRIKSPKGTYDSVYDYSIDNNSLHHAADAIMYLWADYLFNKGSFDDISFSFVNGFKADYAKWIEGYRVRVNNNEAAWVKDEAPACTTQSFLKYMNMIYAYCSTISLAEDMEPIPADDMQIGDVFVRHKMSGHSAIVVDMAVNSKNGQKIFMLAQSGSPAQQTQILINPNNPEISPWYELKSNEDIITPEWTFHSNELMRFKQ